MWSIIPAERKREKERMRTSCDKHTRAQSFAHSFLQDAGDSGQTTEPPGEELPLMSSAVAEDAPVSRVQPQ